MRDFLACRRPPPPPALAAFIAVDAPDGEEAGDLAAHAMSELARTRHAPGRVRQSAWHLLAADALLTYACEAALDGPDAPTAFDAILRRAAGGA